MGGAVTPNEIATFNPYVVIGLLIVVLNLIGYFAAAVVVWILKRVLGDLRSLEAQFARLGETYVRRDDNREDIREIKALLREIFTKLDGKADKVDKH